MKTSLGRALEIAASLVHLDFSLVLSGFSQFCLCVPPGSRPAAFCAVWLLPLLGTPIPWQKRLGLAPVPVPRGEEMKCFAQCALQKDQLFMLFYPYLEGNKDASDSDFELFGWRVEKRVLHFPKTDCTG